MNLQHRSFGREAFGQVGNTRRLLRQAVQAAAVITVEMGVRLMVHAVNQREAADPGGAQSCSATVAQTPSGQSVVATDTELPGLGSAIFSCSDGSWSAPASASCTAPPQACSAAALAWTVGADSCSGVVAQTASGGEANATDNTEPTVGSARFACSNGSWGAPAAASCAVPPPRACSSQLLGWAANQQVCQASVAGAGHGEQAVAQDAAGPALGTARFVCRDGIWLQLTQPAAVCGALQQASGRGRPRSPWARPQAAPWQAP